MGGSVLKVQGEFHNLEFHGFDYLEAFGFEQFELRMGFGRRLKGEWGRFRFFTARVEWMALAIQ